MELYKLTLASILTRKTFVIFAFLLLALPFVLPVLTPWESKPTLLEPARAQTAWALLWVSALGWLLFQGATIGDRWSSHGMLEYFKTLGMSKVNQIAQIFFSCFTIFAGFLAIAFFVSTFTAMPGDSAEAKHWVLTNLQYALLFLMVTAPLLVLAICLGTRINGAAAYAISAGLALYGLFGIGYLEVFLADNESPVLNLVYILSPHYHISDLSSRLVFKLGALPSADLAKIAMYLGGVGMLILGASVKLFRVAK